MSQYPYAASPPYAVNNLNFYQSTYPSASGINGPSPQPQSFGASAGSGVYGDNYGFGGVSGQMGSNTGGGLRTGWLAAFGTEGYEGEPPLLEELGVNFRHIQTKTLAVLNPLARIDNNIMDDADLAGPFLFCALFGTFLLLSGKLWFGYVCGLAALGAASLYSIFSMMSSPPTGEDVQSVHGGSSLSFGRSSSVLGYCLLPLVFASGLGVVLPLDSLAGYALVTLAIAWCTYSSSAMFCVVGRMTNMRGLVAYPLALFYVGFGIMAIFSSRGTGRIDAMKVH